VSGPTFYGTAPEAAVKPVVPPEVYEAHRARCEQATQLNDLGVLLRKERKHLASRVAFQRAVRLSPSDAVIWTNLGSAHWSLAEYDDACRALANALALSPDEPAALQDMGLALGSAGELEGAEAFLRRLIAAKPGSALARLDLSFLLLAHGRWNEGLGLYEARLEEEIGNGFRFPKLNIPYWRGESLEGKTIVVHAEQGVGDTILFSRFLFWLAYTHKPHKLLVHCGAKLVPLLWGYRRVVDFLHEGTPWDTVQADYFCFMGSLPLHAGATPYSLYPDPGFIQQAAVDALTRGQFVLPPPNLAATKLKIGICWTGNSEQIVNHERSVPLELLLPLASDPAVTVYSLQVGPGQSDLRALGGDSLVCDLGPELGAGGYVSTAAAILQLDLVVTCCTSIAHLAGVLGVPCLTMLCSQPYWVWLRDRDTTPWYPKTKLIRQTSPGDWGSVIDGVQAHIRRLL
jgi:hypothetical protein